MQHSSQFHFVLRFGSSPHGQTPEEATSFDIKLSEETVMHINAIEFNKFNSVFVLPD
jgi:hypothetical protein